MSFFAQSIEWPSICLIPPLSASPIHLSRRQVVRERVSQCPDLTALLWGSSELRWEEPVPQATRSISGRYWTSLRFPQAIYRVQLGDFVDGLCAGVVDAVGREIAQELPAPAAEGLAQALVPGDRGGEERLQDLLGGVLGPVWATRSCW